MEILSRRKREHAKKAMSQTSVTYLHLIGLILLSIFMTMQIRGAVCQKEKFTDGIRRYALPSSKLKNFEEVSKLSGEKSVYISLSQWLVLISWHFTFAVESNILYRLQS